MLLEFVCSNHKSIRQPIVFSMLAGSEPSRENEFIKWHKMNLLRSAVIYGANGTGKSNFIDAISFVKNFVVRGIMHQPGDGVRQLPHKLETALTDSKYEMQFIINDLRFAFGFTLNNYLVKEEYLYYFPNGRQTKIYERSGEKFLTGRKFTNKFTACKDILKPNRLLLSCAANFSTVEEVTLAYMFFKDSLVIYEYGESTQSWMNYSLHQMASNKPMKSAVLALMKSIGLDITDVIVEIEEKSIPVDETVLPDFLSDEFKKRLIQEKVDSIQARVIYNSFETDLMSEESAGIKKLFSFLCPFIDIMFTGKVLVCDELETSLHESLLQAILKFFSAFTQSNAQIIFTTHDTSLLDLGIFRRDQIWFTELRKEDRSTDLYSLAEIKNVRKGEKFGKGYILGKYGAIPMLNTSFADTLERLSEVIK